jgi:orotate phosphoribosyltransferase
MEAKLHDLLSVRRGHFQFEAGHHGDLWLDLDLLLLEPTRLRPFAEELARRLGRHHVEAVVGPLVGGAFVAQMVASELGVLFAFSEAGTYRVPDAFHAPLRGRTVAIVDDAINAGSATRATHAALKSLGARPVAVGALLVLGDTASPFFTENDLPMERIAHLANELWRPAECPLCAAGIPLSIPAPAP